MAIKYIDTSNFTEENWAANLAKEQNFDIPVTYFCEESFSLYFILRTSEEKVKLLKASESNAHIVRYSEELNGVVFGFTPVQQLHGKELCDAMDNGVMGLVKLDEEVSVNALKKLSEGFGQIYFIVFSEDLSSVSSKLILSNVAGRGMIKKALEKVG